MKKYLNILTVFILVFVSFFTLTGCNNVKKDSPEDMIVSNVEERGIRISSKRNRYGDNSITLTATVTPSNATNKKLNWTLTCDDSSINPSDYVNLNVSADTLSCVVTKITRCPVQLKIVVSSQSNPDVFATCYIDFYQVTDVSSIELKIEDLNDIEHITMKDGCFYFVNYTYNDFKSILLYRFDFDFDLGPGTVPTELYNTKTYFKINEDFSEALTAANIPHDSAGIYEFDGSVEVSFLEILSELLDVTTFNEDFTLINYNNHSEILDVVFEFELWSEGGGELLESDSATAYITVDFSGVPVEEISLDQTDLIL